jgi:CheY-like chemotaxis protein
MLTFGFHFPEYESPYVKGDPGRIRQVLANLLSNAVKFTPEGHINLSLTHGSTMHGNCTWRFTVKDQGIGIDKTTTSDLFAPFVQADASTTRRFGGTGLGLAIASRLVAAMGGEIGVESEPAEGSLFWFEVPLAMAVIEPLANASWRAGQTVGEPLSILVAEDNVVIQTLVEGLLRRMGHTVLSVGHGRAAVEAVQSSHFDLVLMDMQMPVMDGLSATAAIRALDLPAARLPIVALTADADVQRRRRFEYAGIDGFLSKPIDSTKLATVVNQMRPNISPVAALGGDDMPCRKSAFLDGTRLDVIASTLGRRQLNVLLAMLRDDIVSRVDSLSALLASGDIVAARRSAHSMCGAAMHLGAMRLGEAARRFEGDAGQDGMIAEFTRTAEATIVAIDRYRDDTQGLDGKAISPRT